MNKNLLLMLLVCLTIAGTVFLFYNKNKPEDFSHLTGNYVYQEQGFEGNLAIQNKNSQAEVSLLTVHIDSLHTCTYEGICTLNKGIITCANTSKPFTITVNNDILTVVSEGNQELCGIRGYFAGNYKKAK